MREMVERDDGRNSCELAGGLYERCCLCGKVTDVLVSESVQLRRHYVQGVGQLCPDCCWEVYRTDDLRAVM